VIPDTPLSEQILRLAHWFTAVRIGTHEFTADGMAAFGSALHACAEGAERLERDLRAARDSALDAAAGRILAEMPAGATVVAPTSDHLTRLIAIARGEVPGVVLLPRRQARAIPWGCPGGGGDGRRDGDGGDAA
jgi:hypothetical protein